MAISDSIFNFLVLGAVISGIIFGVSWYVLENVLLTEDYIVFLEFLRAIGGIVCACFAIGLVVVIKWGG